MAKVRGSQRQVRLFERTTGGMELKREGDLVTLSSGGAEQSRVDLSRPGVLDFEYMQHLTLLLDAWDAPPAAVRAFHAGAGACALPLAWNAHRPGSSQVAVDLDGELVELLRKWRLLPQRGVRLKAGDAKVALESARTFDVVVRDAFDGQVTPRALATLEWAELAASRLSPGGLYLANVAHGPASGAWRAKSDVAAALAVFDEVAIIADRKVWRGARLGNLALAAWTAPQDDSGAAGGIDLDFLERETRRLALPAAVYRHDQVRQWVAGTRPDSVGSSKSAEEER